MVDETRPEHGPDRRVQGLERAAHDAGRLDAEDPLGGGVERRDDAVLAGRDHTRVHSPQEPLVVLLDRDDLVIELRVLEADGELAGQGLQEVELVPVEGVPGELGADEDHGHQPPVPDGHGHIGAPGAEILQHGARVHARGPGADVVPDERGRAVRQFADQRVPPGHHLGGPRGGRVDVPRHERREGVAVPDPYEDRETLEVECPVDEIRHGRRDARGVREGAHRPAALADQGPRVVGRPVQISVRQATHARREPEEQGGRGQAQHHGARRRERRVRSGE